MTGVAAEVAALNAELAGRHSPWHAFVSRGTEPHGGLPASRGGRVWACRCLPVHPCEPGCTNPDHSVLDGRSQASGSCGRTLEADTPGEMREKLAAEAGS